MFTPHPMGRRRSRYVIVAAILAACGCRSTSPAPLAATSRPAIGTSLDDIDARNRADISAQLGRPVATGPATPEEVVAMTKAGVDPMFILNYVNRSTMVRPLTAQDVIYLHDQGVSQDVIQAMLTPGASCPRSQVVRVIRAPRAVSISDPRYPYGDPYVGYSVGWGYGRY